MTGARPKRAAASAAEQSMASELAFLREINKNNTNNDNDDDDVDDDSSSTSSSSE
jgi:hypothetical protein